METAVSWTLICAMSGLSNIHPWKAESCTLGKEEEGH
jgi:hypothetical protein